MKRFAIVENGVVTNPAARAEAPLNNSWIELPTGLAVQIGWRYENGAFIEPVAEDEPVKTKVPLTNIIVSSANAVKPDRIWWLPKAEQYTLTGNLPLPDGVFMFMLEKAVNGDRVVSDERELAIVKNGVVTVTGEFETKGNFIISAARLNEGLANIGHPIELEFEDIEFDVYGVIREELKTMV